MEYLQFKSIELKLSFRILIILGSVLLNCLFNWICLRLSLPLFGDSGFTIAAAMFLGPGAGVAVGFLTNLFLDIFKGFTGEILPFAVANILTGLFVGILAKKGRLANPIFILWSILGMVLINAGAGTLISLFWTSARNTAPVKDVIALFSLSGVGKVASGFMARLPINLVDKGLPILVLYPVYKYLFFDRIWKSENFPDSF